MTRILACVDGSVYTQSVCDHAAWAAERTGDAVELLHVLGRRDVSSAPADLSGSLSADDRQKLLAEFTAHDEQRAKLMQVRGRSILEEAKARIQAAGQDAQGLLRQGDLVETLAEFEAEARLVVIGKRGEAADFARLHLGSNLERAVRSSHKPVLVASRAFRPVNRFLIAFDGGPSATKAVDIIAQGPLLRGIECHLLMVGSPKPQAEAALDAAAARLREAGYPVHAETRPGHAEEVIAAYVEQAGIDLLVMGAYGHSRIRNLIIGSTTTAMVRACKVPVLMIR
ncbi:universal stress protein [Indioceanicola profundi]|uniref:universal stress protein n=1 Tax=Indioceanicola profundi TaxID=2220096 RepID=UPI000E6ABFAF|nr:universal stress protein [Indioceanicola profundi]